MLAIIGGSGFDWPAAASPNAADQSAATPAALSTPWGDASEVPRKLSVQDRDLLLLHRHGQPHQIAPHRVNYRANLWQLKQHGASAVLAINAVGAMGEGMQAGSLVLPDQLIDYTWGRQSSFFDGDQQALRHIEFAEPFDAQLRAGILAAARKIDLRLFDGGCYGVTQGPRLETAAEIRRLVNDGCDLVGMTAMPEAALARELELPYVVLGVVANRAAGLGPSISMDAILEALARGLQEVYTLLSAWVPAWDQGR